MLDILPIVMEIERRAVIDKCRLYASTTVWVLYSAINVSNERIEPNRRGSEIFATLSPAAGSNITEPGR